VERSVMKNAGLAFVAGLSLVLLGCSQKAPAPAAAPATEPATAAAASTAAASSWTPEALEELAAPIALYPDDILGHVLTAATNPQEVLDAGNWLLENQNLSGKALDQAASKLGMSTSMRAVLQFPETVDMMCMNIEWTTRLGQAFLADQGAVLAAVQRLRAQAQAVGNLKTAGPLKVEDEKQGDQTVIVIQPADPKVVYVPQYDPVAVYAPPPAVIPPPAAVAPAATTPATTTVVQEGHSTGALITTGLLAFGAGMLVNEVFNNNDDYYRYQPNYGYGGMYYGGRPYYPPPPSMYRPPYGGGYYPAHGYTRPPNYQHGFNNNTIVVNNQGNSYWNQNRGGGATTLPARSPITSAKPNRPELAGLDRDAGARRTQPAAPKPDWKGQPGYSGKSAADGARPAYNGARPEYQGARDNMVQNSARPNAPATPGQRPQGSYAGAKDRPAAPAAAARPTAKAPVQRPTGAADRGRDAMPALAGGNAAQNRPNVSRPQQNHAAEPAAAAAAHRTPPSRPQAANRDAFSGGGNAASERAASDRGRASVASSKPAAKAAARPAAAPASAGGKKVRR
jgi:hypothetical protein